MHCKVDEVDCGILRLIYLDYTVLLILDFMLVPKDVGGHAEQNFEH